MVFLSSLQWKISLSINCNHCLVVGAAVVVVEEAAAAAAAALSLLRECKSASARARSC